MNKNDFIKLINLLVDKKIKEILPKMVENEVRTYMESGIQPDEFDFDLDAKELLPYTKSSSPIIRDNTSKRQKMSEEKVWTKNPVINKILNETAKNPTKLPVDPSDSLAGSGYQQLLESEYQDIGNEFTFNTKNMTSAISRPMPTQQNANVLKQQVMMDGAQPEIANAMIKNYGPILKKLDKAAKKVRGGGLSGGGAGESW